MTEKLKQTIQEEVMKLPKEAQEAINSLDWAKVAEEIGIKFLLTEDEVNNFQLETLLVLVGLEDGNYYAQNIENEVGTSKDEAEKISQEINQKIFIPIYGVLEETIKRNLKSKNPNSGETLDFILSGGDYSAFMERPRENSSTPANATPQEGNGETEETVIPVFSIK